MARERQVTRTINAIEVVAICMSIKDMTPCEKTLSLTGDTPNNEQAMKQLKKIYETEDFKVVAVKEINVTEKLFGMSEIDFLKYAVELDTETRKPIQNA